MRWAVSAAVIATLACAHAPRHDAPLPETLRVVDPRQPAKPLIVLLEMNPWLMVIGSDMPTFALYADGTVIYLKHDWLGKRVGPYVTAKLSPAEVEALVAAVRPLEALTRRHEISGCTDMPTYAVVTFAGGTPRPVSVYGPLEGLPECVQRSPPEQFVAAHRRLREFRAANAREWVPAVVEIMFWDFNYARAAVDWPKAWPDVDDAATQPGENAVGQIYVEGAGREGLEAFLPRDQRTAVVMNDKKWAVAYRYVFPGEEQWKKSLPRSH